MNFNNRLKSLRKSENAVRLGKNLAWLSLLQLASFFFPLITMPYLARVIGVSGYGRIAFASAVVIWFQTITNWGFQYTSTRDISRVRDDKEKTSYILSNTLWSSTLLMLVCAVILILLCVTVPKFIENRLVLLMTFLLLPGHILFPEWFFQALERMKYITIFNILSRLIFTISIFIFIKHESQYYIQPLLISLGYIVSGIIASYFIFSKWGYKLYRPNFHSIWQSLKRSADVFINEIVPNLYNSLSIVILGFFWGPNANGLLDVGTKFSTIGSQLTSVVSRTFFPLLSRDIHYHKYLTAIQLTISGLFAVLLMAGAPLIIKIFYTPDFDAAIPIIRILGFSIFFIALSNVYGTNYLIVQGYERDLRNITLTISILGCCMAFPLIYKYGYWGCALVIAITRMLLGVIITLRARYLRKRSQNQNNAI